MGSRAAARHNALGLRSLRAPPPAPHLPPALGSRPGALPPRLPFDRAPAPSPVRRSAPPRASSAPSPPASPAAPSPPSRRRHPRAPLRPLCTSRPTRPPCSPAIPLPLWIPPRRPHFSLVPSSLLFTLSLLSPYFSSTLPPSLFVPLLASSLSLSIAALDAMFLSSYPRAHCLPSSPLQRPEKTSTNIRPSLVTCPS